MEILICKPEQKETCNYCNQAYLKKKMDEYTKSGKCKKYSPFIKFTPTVSHCNLCLKSKATKRNMHAIYKHLENMHKAEMATLKLDGKHQNNYIEVSANQKRAKQFCRNTEDRLSS